MGSSMARDGGDMSYVGRKGGCVLRPVDKLLLLPQTYTVTKENA